MPSTPGFLPAALRDVLVEKIAESARMPASAATSTPRLTYGGTRLSGRATAVIGMRRVGKTTFVHQLRRQRVGNGLPAENLPYVNLEDERLRGLDVTGLTFLENEFNRLRPDVRKAGPVVWHLDEIQNVPGWERFVRRLLDSDGNEVIVTGSSSALLSREIATSLRGRSWTVPLYPFSFAETLRHRGAAIPEPPFVLSGQERARLEHAFVGWLSTGGLPEAQQLDPETRWQLLRDQVDVAVLRDVIERHEVRQPVALRWMVRQLLSSPAALFSVQRLYRAMRSQQFGIAKDTLHEMLSYLEDSFLIRLLWMESASERQRMVNPRKAYPADTGLLSIFAPVGRTSQGQALETAVLVELERRRLDVRYVRTPKRREVDFLARKADGSAELIQVAADASDPATEERELRALEEAGEMFPGARKRLLTLTADGLPPNAPPDVVARPAYEWMLTPPER